MKELIPCQRDKEHGEARRVVPGHRRAFFADALWASEAQKSIARETNSAVAGGQLKHKQKRELCFSL